MSSQVSIFYDIDLVQNEFRVLDLSGKEWISKRGGLGRDRGWKLGRPTCDTITPLNDLIKIFP